MNKTMTSTDTIKEHLRPVGPSRDPDYLAWREQEIRAALEEANDRSNMISIDKAWEALGIER